MITAEKLNRLTNLDPQGLATMLADSGHSGASFESAKFVGITTGGQLCYSVTFWDENGGPEGGIVKGKVFLSCDHNTGSVTADY